MAAMPDSLRLTPAEAADLETIREEARERHARARKAAAKRGRIDFPDLPVECSWAYEVQFLRSRRL